MLRASLSKLPHGNMRVAAFAAFDRLVHDAESAEHLVLEEARNDLLAAVPDLKPTVDRLFSRRATRRE